MRTAAIIFCITILSVIILVKSGIVDALIVFLLSGSLPGTPIALSPTMMMAVLVSSAWLALSRMTALGAINALAVRRFLHRHLAKQARMPKRRYSRI